MEIRIPARSPRALLFFQAVANGQNVLFNALENEDRIDRIQCPCANEYSTFCIQECGPISRHSDIVVGAILVNIYG